MMLIVLPDRQTDRQTDQLKDHGDLFQREKPDMFESTYVPATGMFT